MNDARITAIRMSPELPYSYVILSCQDADALDRFVETNERPSILMPGTRPSFDLCEYIRAAPPAIQKNDRVRLAVQWATRKGRPVPSWRTWTVEREPAESDYDEPLRDATITTP